MQATRRLLYKGFWGRSLDEFKRLSNIAIKLEGIKGPSGPYELHTFTTPESIKDCKLMSDADMGGFSTAHMDWVPPSQNQTQHPQPSSPQPKTRTPEQYGYARFYGNISTRLPPTRPDIQRSGYAGFRTQDRPPTIFGKALWDIDPYVYLALRVRSDGRSYFVNVQTDSVVQTDLHQHRLFTKLHGTPSVPVKTEAADSGERITNDKFEPGKQGEWETILIKWNDFVRTNHGFVVEPQFELLRQKVRSVGIGLTDRIEGPYEICVSRIWATNNREDAEADGPVTVLEAATNESADGIRRELEEGGGLKNRHGETISWGR